MAVLQANKPYSVVAKQSVSFAAAGINPTNTVIIYRVQGAYLSFRPERPINAIDSFVANIGYNIIPKIDIDLTEFLSPPLPMGEEVPMFRYVDDVNGVLIG